MNRLEKKEKDGEVRERQSEKRKEKEKENPKRRSAMFSDKCALRKVK